MFKKIITAAMALTLCASGMAASNTGFAKNFAPTAITANAAFQSYVKAFPAGTKLYTSPTSGVVAQTLAQGGSFTIVEEQTVGTNVYGKFKSGAGWAIVRTVDPTPQVQVPFTQYFGAGTKLYTSPTSGVVAMTLTQGSIFTIVEVQTANGVNYGRFKSGAGWAVLEGNPDPDPVPVPTQDYFISAYKNNVSKVIAVGRQTVSGPCAAYALAYCRTMLDGYTHSYTQYYDGEQCWWSWGNYTPEQYYTSKLAAFQRTYDLLNKGQPVIFRIKGTGTNDHYVTCVGYRKGANRSSLTASDFYIIDPARPSSELNSPVKRLTFNDLRNVGGYYKIVVKA